MKTFLESADRLHLRFVARTPRDRALGLMHQRLLAPNEGALFVYETPTKSQFWNKNVDFPICIGFFDQQHKLIDVKHLDANQIEAVGPHKYYCYALETSVGFFDDISLGTLLDSLVE